MKVCVDSSKGRAYFGGESLSRLDMEEHLDRPLRQDEVVHHIDGDPSNDSIENLQVMTRNE